MPSSELGAKGLLIDPEIAAKPTDVAIVDLGFQTIVRWDGVRTRAGPAVDLSMRPLDRLLNGQSEFARGPRDVPEARGHALARRRLRGSRRSKCGDLPSRRREFRLVEAGGLVELE